MNLQNATKLQDTFPRVKSIREAVNLLESTKHTIKEKHREIKSKERSVVAELPKSEGKSSAKGAKEFNKKYKKRLTALEEGRASIDKKSKKRSEQAERKRYH